MRSQSKEERWASCNRSSDLAIGAPILLVGVVKSIMWRLKEDVKARKDIKPIDWNSNTQKPVICVIFEVALPGGICFPGYTYSCGLSTVKCHTGCRQLHSSNCSPSPTPTVAKSVCVAGRRPR
ncbi:hypothetical protein P171DRAFT_114298 [Karstenula rhodostoma CBS 690.94]|uniref:Uncharacterized protein n=1 Tax=Karstenula rhodostoma CBS 690.94 TaxID=1392251 RepID=A0A9P4P9S7_9PLEO|nr:hypothetical protein P171DRAFT_114298 [Karstenula rhodostoma CBS 690.94]